MSINVGKMVNGTFAEDGDGGLDFTSWMTNSVLADFFLMHSNEIKYLCMLAYTYYHGCKLFGGLKEEQSLPYKFVRMIFQCTGGGILVPIFINAIPVSLGNDAYPIAIGASFLLHNYFPILREVVSLSPALKAGLIFMYENQRASVVCKLTSAAAAAIPATEFSFPLFGPIFCGAVAGCGGAFLPLNKGLDPIEGGLASNMSTAFVAATCFHLFLNTSLSEGVEDAAKKAQVTMACFFIASSLHTDIGFSKLMMSGREPTSTVAPESPMSKKNKKAKKA